jgi:hypothetical protein
VLGWFALHQQSEKFVNTATEQLMPNLHIAVSVLDSGI